MTRGTVYRALDADGGVLYVGMSTRLADRLKEHAKDSVWWPLASRIEHDGPLPLAEAFRSECDQIIMLRPRFNRNGGVAQGRGTTAGIDVAAWRERYEGGATIEDIALDARLSITTVRARLVAAGTVMRSPGQRTGTAARYRANRKAPASPVVVRVAFAGTCGVHRRRGGLRAA